MLFRSRLLLLSLRRGPGLVIRIDPSTRTAKTVATVSPQATETGNGPFGPPALQQLPYWSKEDSLDDVVVVAESWDQGFSEDQGGMYMLALIGSNHRKEGSSGKKSESSALTFKNHLEKISSWSYSAIAPPLVYGDSVFLGAAGGNLAGFTGDKKNDLSGLASGREDEILPRWNFKVAPNPRNVSLRKFSCVLLLFYLNNLFNDRTCLEYLE